MRPRAVLLDAFGTLVTLDAPAPQLRALLSERLSLDVTEAQAREALRAEVRYYRAHLHEGVDTEHVAELHARCAEVLRAALPPSRQLDQADVGTLTALLLDSLHFSVFPEVAATLTRLRDAGLTLVVASNWDASLDSVLHRAGLLELLDGAVNSATTGFAKPDGRLLECALDIAGVTAADAVHVGDSFHHDVGAALAAGVRPVLLARDGRAGEVERGREELTIPELHVIRTLSGLPQLLGI
jgi:putative hydrolase of the HAD superfamily